MRSTAPNAPACSHLLLHLFIWKFCFSTVYAVCTFIHPLSIHLHYHACISPFIQSCVHPFVRSFIQSSIHLIGGLLIHAKNSSPEGLLWVKVSVGSSSRAFRYSSRALSALPSVISSAAQACQQGTERGCTKVAFCNMSLASSVSPSAASARAQLCIRRRR